MNLLLTGARAPVTLALARAFDRAGHRVSVADSFTPHLCQSSNAVWASLELPAPRWHPDAFFSRLENKVLSERFDWVIPTCEEVFYIARGAEHSPLRAHFLVDRLETLSTLHHKGKFIALCQALNLNAPETHTLESKAALDTFRSRESGKWIFKPAYSRFATQTHEWSAPEEAFPVLDPQSLPWVAQRFLEGREFCTYSVVRAGRVRAHVAYRPLYRAGRGAGVYLESLRHRAALEFVERLAAQLEFSGQMAFDFIENPAGLWPLECNPRAVSGAALLCGLETAEDGLARAWLEEDPREDASLLEAPAGIRATFALPTLLYGLGQAPPLRLLSDLLRARDLVWDARDPAPFLHQLACLWAMQRRGRQLGMSALEASTWDIAWNGPARTVEQTVKGRT